MHRTRVPPHGTRVRPCRHGAPHVCFDEGVRNDNLTAEEARGRSALLRVDSYDVHVDLTHAADPERLAYPVRAAVRFEVLAEDPAAQTTFIEYLHHSVEAITLNGRSLDPATAVLHYAHRRAGGRACCPRGW